MGTAESERDAEALSGTDRDVSAELAGSAEEGEGEEIGGGNCVGAGRVRRGKERFEIFEALLPYPTKRSVE